MQDNERRFEEDIEKYLVSNAGYIKGEPKTYDREKAIDMNTLISFIKASQPNEWKRYESTYKDNAEDSLYKRFSDVVDNYGLIYALRHGIKDRGITIQLAYFRPETTLNEKLVKGYEANIFTCTRQFKYSTRNENSIDMVLSLNGIPLIAIELKNQLKGQSVENARKQFMENRDPRELCFKFNKRFLVYFAVDLYDIAMTTQLKGNETFFLPFNQGSNGAGNVGGAGNPENPKGYASSYLWEEVLKKICY